MPYQRAFSTLGCAELTLAESLALAARHQLDGIELRAAAGTIELPDYCERVYGTPENLARAVCDAGGRIVAFDTSLRLANNTPVDRNEFLKFVPWAERLGVPWLRVFDGKCEDGGPGEAVALATLRWWQALRRQNGWRVDCMVETHDALLDSGEISRFVAAAPGTKILWDTHHTWKLGGEDPVATWRAIAPHVAHLHVKDSVSGPNAAATYTYVLPGTGEFPMAPLARILREEFPGVVSLEWERLWHPHLAPLDDALSSAAATAWW